MLRIVLLLGIVILSACGGPNVRKPDSTSLSLITECHSPSKPLDDPILVKLLEVHQPANLSEFAAADAREFANKVAEAWNASLGEVEACLDDHPEGDQTCALLRECQGQIAAKL